MSKLEESMATNSLPSKYAVERIGLQPIRPNIWVLNKDLHVKENGEAIDIKDSPVVWIEEMVNGTLASKAVASASVHEKRHITQLIDTLYDGYGANFAAAVMALGAQVHYDMVKDEDGGVPSAILVGSVSMGSQSSS